MQALSWDIICIYRLYMPPPPPYMSWNGMIIFVNMLIYCWDIVRCACVHAAVFYHVVNMQS